MSAKSFKQYLKENNEKELSNIVSRYFDYLIFGKDTGIRILNVYVDEPTHFFETLEDLADSDDSDVTEDLSIRIELIDLNKLRNEGQSISDVMKLFNTSTIETLKSSGILSSFVDEISFYGELYASFYVWHRPGNWMEPDEGGKETTSSDVYIYGIFDENGDELNTDQYKQELDIITKALEKHAWTANDVEEILSRTNKYQDMVFPQSKSKTV